MRAALTSILACTASLAGAPGEVAPTVRLDADHRVVWDPEPDAEHYNVYKGLAPASAPFAYVHVCFRSEVGVAFVDDPAPPSVGQRAYYLVTKVVSGSEGPSGSDSSGAPRPPPGACVDADADGVADPIDNCPLDSNSGQSDFDLDGQGDACDADDDDDGLADDDELALGSDPTDPDSDDDGLGDGFEVHVLGTNPAAADSDGDRVGDAADNCPLVANTDQLNADADGLGDACERRLAWLAHDSGGGVATRGGVPLGWSCGMPAGVAEGQAVRIELGWAYGP